MSFWMVMAVIGGVGLLGSVFAAMIFRLDAATLEELNAQDDDRWTSIVRGPRLDLSNLVRPRLRTRANG